jgi:hypothetical protein
VLRDAVALILENELGNDAGDDSIQMSNHAKPLELFGTRRTSAAWEGRNEHNTYRSNNLHPQSAPPSSSASHSTTPIPVEYISRSDHKRPRHSSNDEPTNRRLHYSYAPTSLSFEETRYGYYDGSSAPNPIRRKSSDATMIRQHDLNSSSASQKRSPRFNYRHAMPSQVYSSSQLARVPLHRRRSSGTDVSSSNVLLGDMQNGYNEFDLFNGQLLESDAEDRGAC